MRQHPTANVPINLSSSPTNPLVPEGLSSPPPQFPTTNNSVETHVTPTVCDQKLVILKLMRAIRTALLMKRTVYLHHAEWCSFRTTGYAFDANVEHAANRRDTDTSIAPRNGCFLEKTLGNSTLHDVQSWLQSSSISLECLDSCVDGRM